MEEVWKDVVGYEGFYQVSNLGRVRNTKNKYILSQYIANNGYMSLRFGKCDKTKKMLMLVHRLVAEAFVPNPNNFLCVGHIDENRLNNCANNLKWCTHLENNNETKHKQRISIGRKQVSMKGKKQTSKIICDEILYNSITEFCRKQSLNIPTVWRWLQGITAMPNEWKERGLRYA